MEALKSSSYVKVRLHVQAVLKGLSFRANSREVF